MPDIIKFKDIIEERLDILEAGVEKLEKQVKKFKKDHIDSLREFFETMFNLNKPDKQDKTPNNDENEKEDDLAKKKQDIDENYRCFINDAPASMIKEWLSAFGGDNFTSLSKKEFQELIGKKLGLENEELMSLLNQYHKELKKKVNTNTQEEIHAFFKDGYEKFKKRGIPLGIQKNTSEQNKKDEIIPNPAITQKTIYCPFCQKENKCWGYMINGEIICQRCNQEFQLTKEIWEQSFVTGLNMCPNCELETDHAIIKHFKEDLLVKCLACKFQYFMKDYKTN